MTIADPKKHASDQIRRPVLRGEHLEQISTAVSRARWYIAIVALSFVVLAPYFAAGDPPGVDAPTFLHFAWVFEQSVLGSGSSFLNDPWWYGGLPYLQAYSPAGYGAVGLLSAITPLELATAFKLVMALSLAATAATTYWLGRTLRLSALYAFFGTGLLIFSYPVIAGIGIFGWLPTLTSMPFAIGAYVYLEKWISSRNQRFAIYAGVLLGIALLAHHMTAIALGIVIAVRFAVFWFDNHEDWRMSGRTVLLIGGATTAVSVWWAIPFLVNTISVGFQRELPGNWEFGLSTFMTSLFDRGRIGVETYPSYVGIIQGALGIGGGIYAIVYRTKFRGLAITAAVLFWFSMGASGNPLIRVYPFSGFDVSRFAFYVAPMLALLSAVSVRAILKSQQLSSYSFAPAVLIAVLLVLPVADVLAARESLAPVDEPQAVSESVQWISDNVPEDSKVLAVGYRNWDGYWIPQRAGVAIMDGWYDEGAANWRNVRDYRLMGWLGNMDVDRLHEIMLAEQTDYLVVTLWDTTESPGLFERTVSQRPDLFRLETAFADTTVYRPIHAD